MKNKEIKLKIMVGILIIIIILLTIKDITKNRSIISKSEIIKEMTQTEFDNQITQLNNEHTQYAQYIESCKEMLATVITNKGVEVSKNDSFESIANSIEDISALNGKDYIEFEIGGYRDMSSQKIFDINPSGFKKVVFTIMSANTFSGSTIYSVNGTNYTITTTSNNIGLVSEYDIETDDNISITFSGANFAYYNIKLYFD